MGMVRPEAVPCGSSSICAHSSLDPSPPSYPQLPRRGWSGIEAPSRESIAPLGRESSLGSLSADFFNKLFAINCKSLERSKGGGGGAVLGRRLGRRPVLKTSRESKCRPCLFACTA